MSTVRCRGVRFVIYPQDHMPVHTHGRYGGAVAIVELFPDGTVDLADREDNIIPADAKRNDVRKILNAAAECYDEIAAATGENAANTMSRATMGRVVATDGEIDAALAKAKGYDSVRPKAVSVSYRKADEKVVIVLATGVEIAIPRQLLQGLANAKASEIADVVVDNFGSSLHWETLDLDHYVPGLLNGVFGTKSWMAQIGKKGGSSVSDAKAAAAQINGTKGGRPRGPALDARLRDADGHIRAKHPETRIATLRETFGDQFATGFRGNMRLDTVLDRTGAETLRDLLEWKKKNRR